MALVEIAAIIAGARAGKIVSFSTDTVPALAVIPQAAQAIYRLKQRPLDKPLILMGASLEELWDFVDTNHRAFTIWQEVANSWLPGALTLVLPQNPNIAPLNIGGFNTIGIRIPAHKQALTVLRQTAPLLTTSANLSGESTLLTAAQISAQFPEVLVLDDLNYNFESAKTSPGIASTVLAWTETGWEVKRQGLVKIS